MFQKILKRWRRPTPLPRALLRLPPTTPARRARSAATTIAEWDELAEECHEGLLVACFDASWCAASQRARPGYAKLAVDPALEYATFASVDVEEADELLVQARNVEALPTYQLVQNGRLLLQFTGSDDVKLKMETIRFGRGLGLSTQKHRLAR